MQKFTLRALVTRHSDQYGVRPCYVKATEFDGHVLADFVWWFNYHDQLDRFTSLPLDVPTPVMLRYWKADEKAGAGEGWAFARMEGGE